MTQEPISITSEVCTCISIRTGSNNKKFRRGRSYQIVKVENTHIKKHDITSEIFLN